MLNFKTPTKTSQTIIINGYTQNYDNTYFYFFLVKPYKIVRIL